MFLAGTQDPDSQDKSSNQSLGQYSVGTDDEIGSTPISISLAMADAVVVCNVENTVTVSAA